MSGDTVDRKYTQADVEKIVNARVQEHVKRMQEDQFKSEFRELKDMVSDMGVRLDKSNHYKEQILDKLSMYDRYVDGFGLVHFTPEIMASVMPAVQWFIERKRLYRWLVALLASPVIVAIVELVIIILSRPH